MDRKSLPDKVQIRLLELDVEMLYALADASNRYSSYLMIGVEQDRIRKHYRQLEQSILADFGSLGA